MNRRALILMFVALIICSLSVKGETTMELLINKDWHEVNPYDYQPRDDYYVRYTGTQRMIVGEDEDGNMKVRLQEYYLSDKIVNKFEQEKVGTARSGRYLVFRSVGEKNEKSCHCYEILDLDATIMNMKAVGGQQNVSKCFVVYSLPVNEEEMKPQGDVISTLDLLVGKKWYEVNEKMTEKLAAELEYDRSGKFLHCKMGQNPQREIPEWSMREFYLSNEIEYEFNHSRIGEHINGRYLVVKEKNSQGEWFVANYDITTLSSSMLKLECVYPIGVKPQTYVSKMGLKLAQGKRVKPQQWQLMENEWYRMDTISLERRNFVERFDETKVYRRYEIVENGIKEECTEECVYYMSNTPDTLFDHARVGQLSEGEYLVVNERRGQGERFVVNYKIDYVDEKNMLLSILNGDKKYKIAYDRDLSNEEERRLLERDSLSGIGRSTLDYLSGKQWRFSKLPHPSMSRWQRWYFTDSLFLSVDFNYDVVNKHWETKIDSKEFYLSEWVHHNFALTEMKKKHKNGRYINFYKMAIVSTPIAHLRTHNIWKVKRRQRFTKNMEKRSYAYEIKLLTDNLFSYSTVPMEFNPHNRFYERGIPTNRLLKYTLVCD